MLEDTIRLDSSLLEPINYVTSERTSNQSFERLRRHYALRFLNNEERGFEDDLALRLEVEPTDLQTTMEAEFFLHQERIQAILNQTVNFLESSSNKASLAIALMNP